MEDRYTKSKAELRSRESQRSRSRSPRKRYSSESSDDEPPKHRRRDDRRRRRSSSSSSSEEKNSSHILKAPPPPIISKLISKPTLIAKTAPKQIQLKLNAPVKGLPSGPAPKLTVASAFNQDSDDEVEEMPAECKMRMRNVGKNTPTSSGPNSFGKTKLGFVDSKKIFEKKQQQMLKDMGD